MKLSVWFLKECFISIGLRQLFTELLELKMDFRLPRLTFTEEKIQTIKIVNYRSQLFLPVIKQIFAVLSLLFVLKCRLNFEVTLPLTITTVTLVDRNGSGAWEFSLRKENRYRGAAKTSQRYQPWNFLT